MTHSPDGGRYFEDFSVGDQIVHATPRTVTDGERALDIALTGNRCALFSSAPFAERCGLTGHPIDPLLAFHIVFGKSVPDISINAVANLGYAGGRFLAPVRAGDTLSAISDVVGVKENSSGKTGVVYVHTQGFNQNGAKVLEYWRWVMVNKRDPDSPAPEPQVPALPDAVAARELVLPEGLDFSAYNDIEAGSPKRFGDYRIGDKIDHVDGMTVEEAEHQIATRLYQNTAKVHFNLDEQAKGRFGKRLIYGGVAISIVRALSFNGLANAGLLLGINGGRHVAPLFAGDTVYAWSEVVDTAELSPSIGALRLRHVGLKNMPAAAFPDQEAGRDHAHMILDLDVWAAIPQ